MQIRQSQVKLLYASFVLFIILVVGTFFFHYYENWDWLDSAYFAVTTLSTVGYGDLHPTHAETKIFIMGFIIFGVAIMFYALNALGQYWVERREGGFHRRIDSFTGFSHKVRKAARRMPKPPTAF